MSRPKAQPPADYRATLYFASWCGPCGLLKSELAKPENRDLAAVIERVDVDRSSRRADAAGVQAVPTLVRADGARLEGAHTMKKIRKWLEGT